MRTKWESSEAWLFESIVTHRRPNHMRALVAGDTSDAFKTPLSFIIAPFVNLGDRDEILQLGISDWHSTFCKS